MFFIKLTEATVDKKSILINIEEIYKVEDEGYARKVFLKTTKEAELVEESVDIIEEMIERRNKLINP